MNRSIFEVEIPESFYSLLKGDDIAIDGPDITLALSDAFNFEEDDIRANLIGKVEEVKSLIFLAFPRSPQWPSVRMDHLLIQPVCQVCGSKTNPEVHHIQPYHLFPKLELDMANLITLCSLRCHFIFGHFFNWQKYNPDVIAMCKMMRESIRKAAA